MVGADHQPDLAQRRIEDGQLVAQRDGLVGQPVRFAILADRLAVRPDQVGSRVELVAFLLLQIDGDDHRLRAAATLAMAAECGLGRRAAVGRHAILGQADDVGPLGRCPVEHVQNMLKVSVLRFPGLANGADPYHLPGLAASALRVADPKGQHDHGRTECECLHGDPFSSLLLRIGRIPSQRTRTPVGHQSRRFPKSYGAITFSI